MKPTNPDSHADARSRKKHGLLAFLGCVLLLGVPGPAGAAETLIPLGAMWRYLDNGIDQGTAWRQTNFNDSAWPVGPSQLGFGDGDEATIINGGPSNGRFPTIYFRHAFIVVNRENLTNVALRLLRDDGGVVYLNGVEVLRSNIPESPITYGTWSALAAAGSEENAFFSAAIPPALLRGGTNVVAVEIHQADVGSSDLSFNFELLANTPIGNLPPVATVSIAPSIVVTGEVFSVSVTASDPETGVARIEVMQDGVTMRTFLAGSGTFALSNSIVGVHEFTARATDLTGQTGMSPPVRLLVTQPGPGAQSVFFPQFSSAAGLILQNAATVSSNVLHLHRATGGNRGAAWMATPQRITEGFVNEFWFRITSKSGGGADGFSFIIAGTPQPNIGSGGLSYGGITNSLAVEFDTWLNSSDGDPDDRHIGVHTRGVLANTLNESASIGRVTPAADFTENSSTAHKVRIDYVPGALRLFLDNLSNPLLVVSVDLGSLLSLPDGRAWIGLAGGTGASWENHDIWTWSHIGYRNVPPTVVLDSPAQAIRIAPGADLTLTAMASDPDGSVVAVGFFDGDELIAEVASPPYRITWSNPAVGIHAVRAAALDDGDLVSFSAPATIVEVVSTNATVILFPNFGDAGNLILQGSAALVTNRARLTPSIPSQTGGLWLNQKQQVGNGFETVFQFQVSQPSSKGADGFAFVILSRAFPVLGNGGDGLGYSSVSNSLAVEFDTFQNPEATDFDANHIGIHSRGVLANSSDESAALARATPGIDLSDGTVHTVVIRYSEGSLSVFLDDLIHPSLTLAIDLASVLTLENGTAWVGFTATTGGEFENHDLLMWSFRSLVELRLLHPLRHANGNVTFDFATFAGRTYTVQYSDDLMHWRNAVPSLDGTGGVVLWEDAGPPGTDSAPATQRQRFYRIISP